MRKIINSVVCISALFFTSCKDEINQYITYETVENIYKTEYYTQILNDQKEITEDIRPEFLRKGDTVAIFSVSNSVSKNDIEKAITTLKEWGLNVIEAENLYMQDGRYSGELADRIIGTQKLIDNPNIKAMIAARGGYGAAQIIPFLNFDLLTDNPKWIVGYSDITALHAAVNNLGIETIHGAMGTTIGTNSVTSESLRKTLFGESDIISIETNENCVEGVAQGRLVGGNLSLIYSLGGTAYDLNTKGAILLIEDTGESNYSLDRMLTNLKLSGKLDSVEGIIVGQFTSMTQGIDKSVPEIIKEKTKNLNIPVMYGVNIGHGQPNLSVCLGRTIRLTVNKTESKIEYAD